MKTLIRGGRIYDGTKAEPFVGDILVENDRIVKVHEMIDYSEADRIVDISGLSVAPGFIDAHSHNDWFAIKKEPLKYFDPFIRQGITSFVTGNCGLSATGFKADTPNVGKIGGGLFFYNDTTTGTYPSVKEFFDAIDHNTPCNIATLVGHCTARTGEAGYENRELTPEEMKEMLGIMEQGLKDGACGLSLGLMYDPGAFAKVPELREVAKLCEKYGRPLTSHMRALSRVSMAFQPLLGRSHILRAFDEMAQVTKGLKMKFQLSHSIFVGRKSFPDSKPLHEALDKMREDGIDAMFDIYSELLGVSVITCFLPDWYRALAPEKRGSLLTKLRLFILNFSVPLLGFGWDDIVLAYMGPGNEALEGKTVGQYARENRIGGLEAYLRLCVLSDFNGRVNMGPYSTEDIITWQSRKDDCLFMTDAWVEDFGVQNPAVYDCFPKFIRRSLLRLGDNLPGTIRKMSGAVADRFGLKDRGYLRPGCFADITVFDESAMKEAIPDQEKSFGIEKVWINGKLVLTDGELDAEALRTSGHALRCGA